jgi:hypothetical protein
MRGGRNVATNQLKICALQWRGKLGGIAMLTIVKPQRQWSELGIQILVGSIVAILVLSFFDGICRGEMLTSESRVLWQMLATWTLDLRYLAETLIGASAFLIIGGKFIETRTLISIGFDKLDAAKIVVKGPDEDNVVWIGHRYGTQFEAQTVATVFAERLKESAA